MTSGKESSLDTRLLGDAFIELNISRRNVAVYPEGHSLVAKSLDRAYGLLQRLFELRSEIVVAIAKDTIIVDDAYLDRKNPVFREFALALSGVNIACLRMKQGVTKEELYAFHRLMADDTVYLTPENCAGTMSGFGLRHIAVDPVDYGSFVVEEGGTEKATAKKEIWAQYVKGLLDGTLKAEEASVWIRRIPPGTMAELLNQAAAGARVESYDEVITAYLRKASAKWFSGRDVGRLLEVIENLNPDMKKEFLSSSLKAISGEAARLAEVFGEIPPDRVEGFLRILDEQKVPMSQSLKSLIERFSRLDAGALRGLEFAEGYVADDFIVSREVVDLLDEGRYETHISRTYQEELRKIMSCDIEGLRREGERSFGAEWSEEGIAREHSRVVMELLSREVPEAILLKGQDALAVVMTNQLNLMAAAGQYDQLLATVSLLESRKGAGSDDGGRYWESPEFLARVAGSLRSVGREKRREAALLCRHYGERIVPPLLDALCEERSRTVRKFLIGLFAEIGPSAFPAVRRRLGDGRWFVVRNMLYILAENGEGASEEELRPFLHHEDRRVRFEALRCLAAGGGGAALAEIRAMLRSPSRDEVAQAVSLAGSYRLRDLLPELTLMLAEKARSRRDYEQKTAIVRAIGLIGDPRAGSSLRDLLASSSVFFRGDLERLKTEASRVLTRLLQEGPGGKEEDR